ncbi:hypothetical protein AXG93_517s1020 [Marchantia polymorpha subsp. ruderalis]|uniref:Uncharacterized protein n=1 Tax=Marchantia polymorpha subsp. ruderalis TaxID=1480154 RepID=A0A176VI20_MARPO|nr:hypothetical protein AXG93_517s1020 [Marchantia polymorpha subsp. ruderalis]
MATSGGTTKEEKKRETYHGPQWTGAAAAVGWDNPLGLVRGRSLGWDRVLSSVWPAKEGDDVEGAPAGSSTSTARALLAPLSLSFSRFLKEGRKGGRRHKCTWFPDARTDDLRRSSVPEQQMPEAPALLSVHLPSSAVAEAEAVGGSFFCSRRHSRIPRGEAGRRT